MGQSNLAVCVGCVYPILAVPGIMCASILPASFGLILFEVFVHFCVRLDRRLFYSWMLSPLHRAAR